MLLNWSNSQGLNALMNSAEFIAGFADKGSGEVDLVLSKGTGPATFTRATTATTVNSAGLIVSVASGTPRSYYDPTTLAYLGYLSEGARTNLCLQSNAFTTTWVPTGGASPTQNQTGPDGATSAWTITGTGANYNEQTITLTATTYTASIFVKKTTSATNFPVLEVLGTPLAALCTLDTNNGIATVWTARGGGWTIATSSASCSSFGGFWRVSLTFLATAASWAIRLNPCGATSATQSTGVPVGGTGSNVYYGAQVELGSFASTYIPTTTASVPRNADVLTYPLAVNMSNATGSVYAETTSFATNGVNHSIIGCSPAGSVMALYYKSNGQLGAYDGTNLNDFGALALPAATVSKVANSWGGSTMTGAISGVASSVKSFDGSFNFLTSIDIAMNNSAGQELFGTIRNVRIYSAQLSAAQLSAVTA